MRKTKLLIFVICFVLLSGTASCQPQTPLDENTNVISTLTAPVNPALVKTETETPPPSATPVDSLPLNREMTPTPEWDDRNLTGKIVYVDRTANRIVVMDANGENSKEIFYAPGETYEPYLGSPIKWSHDGRKLAFGCQKLSNAPEWKFFPARRGDDAQLSLCILELVENMQWQNSSISRGLQVIEMPEYYMPGDSAGVYKTSRLFASLEWMMDDEGVVLTPFCIVKIDETQTDCTDWGDLGHLDETNKKILQNAEFIAPSPADPKKWALTIDNQILIMNIVTGEIDRIDIKDEDLFLYWSPDGSKMVVLSSSAIGMFDIQTHSYKDLIWGGQYGISIEPGLITARPGTGSYLLNLYFARQNIAWSQDSRYLVLNVYLGFPFAESARIYTGIYYFDIGTGELFPARRGSDELGIPTEFRSEWNIYIVQIDEFKLFTSPDWSN